VILESGSHVAVMPTRVTGGAAVPAYVRATETTSGLFQEGYARGDGNALNLALPVGRYDLLVIPDGDLPPFLIRDQPPLALATTPLTLDDGVPVTGVLTDAAGAPIAGAKVSLRSGALPSTVGTSNATGAFSLRVRAGTYGATIAPGTALPSAELSIDAAPGIPITAETPATIVLRMTALPSTRIGLTVAGAGANAKVLIEGRNMVADAGMVEISAGGATMMRTATMRIRAELPIAANGTVLTAPLPRGHYRATIFASGAAPLATMTAIDDIDATAGDVARTMTMAVPIPLSGTLRQGGETRLARVVAIDDAAPVTLAPQAVGPFMGQADDTGSFSLNVNPSRSYRLVIEPPPGGLFARVTLPAVPVASVAVAIGARDLPRALLYGGRVLGPHLEPVGGVLVSAYCVAATPGCVDSTRPAAEAVSATDGGFRLALPDPGVTP
jgi:hypothetical protein